MPTERTYTISEAAALTGMHRNTIRLRIKMGQLDATVQAGKFGDEYRISHTALQKSGMLAEDGPLGQPEEVLTGHPVEPDPSTQTVEPAEAGDAARQVVGDGATAGALPAALGELYQRHEQAMFRLGYLQGELERLKALADTAESLREDRAAQDEQLSTLKRQLDDAARREQEAETLRREKEALKDELEQARRRLHEMDSLRQDIDQLKSLAEEAQVGRNRAWWQFWRA